ncbi:hypothetical protein QOT17_021962 [Balamuthia mandrillaris]
MSSQCIYTKSPQSIKSNTMGKVLTDLLLVAQNKRNALEAFPEVKLKDLPQDDGTTPQVHAPVEDRHQLGPVGTAPIEPDHERDLARLVVSVQTWWTSPSFAGSLTNLDNGCMPSSPKPQH